MKTFPLRTTSHGLVKTNFKKTAALCSLLLSLVHAPAAERIGIFEEHRDIGKVSKPGSVVFEESKKSYLISGGGENMWFTNDAFHFAWKRVSGDFEFRSAIEWLGTTGNAHRKACLLVRQTLDADSPYIDVACHGDGLISLQFRETPGGQTREIQAYGLKSSQLGIEREGNTFFMTASSGDGPAQVVGPFFPLALKDSVYVGLGVCAHDDRAIEQARFSDVHLAAKETARTAKPILHCTLETVAIASKDRRAIYHTTNLIEAPNWSRDGLLVFNSGGRIQRIAATGGTPQTIDTGFAVRCNNDHGISPDGSTLAISDQTRGGKSMIYTLPISGGEPRAITPLAPSYWHGWSPDGATLAYCAERNAEFDVYTIPAQGGHETRLTTAKGLDDGPDYSADGKFIYFNSDRTGTMQIWRMKPDGSEQEQITSGEFNDWFPHPSPDGKWLVFLSYEKEVSGHPANKLVRLRLMPLGGGPVQELAGLFGGQGTINVPSWSPDSKQIAFVSYELLSR